MALLTEALAAVQARAPTLLPMLERWVRTNSFSGNVDGVNEVGEMLARDLELPSLSLERIAGDGVGDHLVWRTPAWSARPADRLLLIGHHDTVFPPGTFEVWARDGDRLRGPGVLDMKSGLATVQVALSALESLGVLADLPLVFVSVGDEEIGSRHSAVHLRAIAEGARGALVFEAGRDADAIVTQRKGTGRYTVTAYGRAAHAGNRHPDGINAICALAQFIDGAQRLTDYDRGVTVNVGLVEGGSSANTVPARAACTIDFRFVRGLDSERLADEIRGLAARVSKATGARIDVDGGVRRPPLERSDASIALFERYAQCARAAGLGASQCPLMGGGSDANTVSAVGVPVIDGLGPRGAGFHTHDEYIEVSSLAMRLEALVRFLVGWYEDRPANWPGAR